jgi:hypothetical protein
MTKAVRKKHAVPRKHTGPLVIAVGWQQNGGVYMLEPWDKDRIREAFPGAVVIPTMLVGYDKTEDYNRFHRPYWEQIAQMLTGLKPEQIAHFGGIRLWDPVADKILWEWRPEPVTDSR